MHQKYKTQKQILKDVFVHLPSGDYKGGEKSKRIIASTLLRIPEKVRRKAVEDILFVITHKPLLALITYLNLSKKERSGRNLVYIDFHGMKGEGKSEEEMKQIIAHEIAHFELRHHRKNIRNSEAKAEQQTKAWGFKPKEKLMDKIKNNLKSILGKVRRL